MSGFDEFSEKIERVAVCSWRSVVLSGAGCSAMPRSVLFSMDDNGCSWDYSLALRIGHDWVMASRSIEPFEYDIFAPNGDGQNRSYDNVASELAIDMLSELKRKVSAVGEGSISR